MTTLAALATGVVGALAAGAAASARRVKTARGPERAQAVGDLARFLGYFVRALVWSPVSFVVGTVVVYLAYVGITG